MNKEEFTELDDKLKESIDNLQGTQFLDAFCVLNKIKVCMEENTKLKKALNKVREYINTRDTFVLNGEIMQLKDEITGQDILKIIDKALGDDSE